MQEVIETLKGKLRRGFGVNPALVSSSIKETRAGFHQAEPYSKAGGF